MPRTTHRICKKSTQIAQEKVRNIRCGQKTPPGFTNTCKDDIADQDHHKKEILTPTPTPTPTRTHTHTHTHTRKHTHTARSLSLSSPIVLVMSLPPTVVDASIYGRQVTKAMTLVRFLGVLNNRKRKSKIDVRKM